MLQKLIPALLLVCSSHIASAQSLPPCVSSGVGDADWNSGWEPNEPLPTVWDLDVHAGSVYVAGHFDHAGSPFIRNIARWDGSQWRDLSYGVIGTAKRMAWYGDELFVTGSFNVACSPEIQNIARWKEGRGWLPAGESSLHTVASDGQRLFALRPISQASMDLVQWDGTQWNRVATFAGYASALAVDANGKLYVVGRITAVGGITVNGVASWDGVHWDNMGGGITGSCNTYGPYLSGVAADAGRVYVWGGFKSSIGASGSTYWENSAWHKTIFGGPCGGSGGPDIDLLNTIFPDGNAVYYSQQGSYTDGTGSYNDGSTSVAIGTTRPGLANVVATDFAKYNNSILVGFGSDIMIWAGVANRFQDALVATWNGTTLSPFADGLRSSTNHGLPGPSRDLLLDAQGNLYVGGLVDGVMEGYSGLYKMQSPDWQRIMPRETSAMRVECVARYKGGLFVGGNIDRWAGRRHFARFDAESNLTVPAEDVNALVHTMATDGQLLYLGGDFDHVGTMAANHVVAYNGWQWSQLDAGLNGPVWALAYSGGRLYAGGDFTFSSRTQARHLAAWDGHAWSPVNKGADGPVYTILPTDDGLVIGGNFERAGARRSPCVAMLVENEWRALGEGFDDDVRGLAMSDGGWLYATGRFTHSGATEMNRAARWNGVRWSSMGSGLDNTGRDVVAIGKHIYLGGYFTTAGSKPSQYFAEWIEREPAITPRAHDRPALMSNVNLPSVTALGQNHPNPFNPTTQVPFTLSAASHVRLAIYDAQGKLVRTLVDEDRRAGQHSAMWNGTDDRGAPVASGVYFSVMRAGSFEATRKMVLLK